jgi:hypothetical protein
LPNRLALGFNPVLPVREAVRLGQKAKQRGSEEIEDREGGMLSEA